MPHLLTMLLEHALARLQEFRILSAYITSCLALLDKETPMFAWLRGHETVLWWLGVLSVVTFVGTLAVLPWVVARLPPDYFTHAQCPFRRRHAQSSGAHLLVHLGKNLLGILIILVGVAMLVLPGQGILTILIGLMLLDFPGKRGLERRLVQQPSVWRAINWMRAKAHQPALQRPTAATTTPDERPETA